MNAKAEQFRALSLLHGKAIRCIQEEFTLEPWHPVTLPQFYANLVVYHAGMRQSLWEQALQLEHQEKTS